MVVWLGNCNSGRCSGILAVIVVVVLEIESDPGSGQGGESGSYW